MPNIVIQIEKDKQILHNFTLQDYSITKDSIEIAVLDSTGLNYDQYEVYYVDCENDFIMTAVQEDYSIAQSTLETDTIVFHIDVKVTKDQIKIKQSRQEKPYINEKKQPDSEQLEENISQEQKVEQVYQSAISQKNQTSNKNRLQEPLEGQTEKISNQPLNKQQQIKEKIDDVVSQLKTKNEAQKKYQIKNQHQNSNSDNIECDFQGLNQNQQEEKRDTQRLAPQNQPPKQQQLKEQLKMMHCLKYLQQLKAEQIMFNKFLHKMSTVLKPQCFRANQSITVRQYPKKKQEHICLVCNQKISQTPYYINYRNQLICQQCEKLYQGGQNLVKIRNEKSRTELFASKFITLSYNQLSRQNLLYFLRQSDQKNRQKKIDQLIVFKMQGQKSK